MNRRALMLGAIERLYNGGIMGDEVKKAGDAAAVVKEVAAEIPLTPAEQRKMLKRLEELEARKVLTVADVMAVVHQVLDQRKPADAPDPKGETVRRERTGIGQKEVKKG